MTRPCGGCEVGGSHRRWCPAVVGKFAARRGSTAEQVAAVADSCGIPEAATHLWRASAVLRAEADRLAAQWQAVNADA